MIGWRKSNFLIQEERRKKEEEEETKRLDEEAKKKAAIAHMSLHYGGYLARVGFTFLTIGWYSDLFHHFMN